ncbi:hypothetical protein SAMN04490188_4720 [Pseudomonas kilonensis]|uniref:Uncharacterized protein n=1 Tax=Pseudomonas kilonensis TaxID=132476 RepID=A0ABY0ZFW8_9PSED|nr:hypothetical protein SAMN04490188_4720 [Pseudomonas kilonensis]
MSWHTTEPLLWRGSLVPLGREAALKPGTLVCQANLLRSQREQAPSPQRDSDPPQGVHLRVFLVARLRASSNI